MGVRCAPVPPPLPRQPRLNNLAQHQLPRHGRLRFESIQHLLRLVHWDAQPLGDVLDRQVMSLLLRQISSPLHLRAEFGQEIGGHLAGLDGVGHTAEESGLERFRGVRHPTLHELAHRLRHPQVRLGRLFRSSRVSAKNACPVRTRLWWGHVIAYDHRGRAVPDLVDVEAAQRGSGSG